MICLRSIVLLVFPNWTSQSEETSVALNILKKQAIITPRTCVRMVRLAALFSILALSLIGCEAEPEPTPAPTVPPKPSPLTILPFAIGVAMGTWPNS